MYCSEEWFSIIDASQKAFSIKKGNPIFMQGEELKGIFVIVKGKVKVVSIHENRERLYRLAGEGKIIGHRGFGTRHCPVSAIALTDVLVTYIPDGIVIKLLKTNPALSLFFINFLLDELRESERRIDNMMRVDVKHRIASVLIELADSFGYDIEDPKKLSYTLSRKDLANMAGTTYETVIRTLFYLQEKKLIKLAGKSIYITNTKALKKLP